MELTLKVTGISGKDFPKEYLDKETPQKTEMFFKAAETAIKKRYRMGDEVEIIFEVKE